MHMEHRVIQRSLLLAIVVAGVAFVAGALLFIGDRGGEQAGDCPELPSAATNASGIPGTEVGDEANAPASDAAALPAADPNPGELGAPNGDARSPSVAHSGDSAHQLGSATGLAGSQAAATECLPPGSRG
jgi:hypothetical protein